MNWLQRRSEGGSRGLHRGIDSLHGYGGGGCGAEGLHLNLSAEIQSEMKTIKVKVKIVYLRNIQLQRAYKKNDLTAKHVIKTSIGLQLWIIISGGWY